MAFFHSPLAGMLAGILFAGTGAPVAAGNRTEPEGAGPEGPGDGTEREALAPD